MRHQVGAWCVVCWVLVVRSGNKAKVSVGTNKNKSCGGPLRVSGAAAAQALAFDTRTHTYPLDYGHGSVIAAYMDWASRTCCLIEGRNRNAGDDESRVVVFEELNQRGTPVISETRWANRFWTGP
jgi:hypothetical protein